MSAINDLTRQIKDNTLRERLEQEIGRISKDKKFGLVFEDHIPECTPLYSVPVKKGANVAVKCNGIKDIYLVIRIANGKATCIHSETGEETVFSINEIVTVAEFGEPIFPHLTSMGKVENAHESSLWHTLIEADNYHALQLLEYLYPKQVDCIYIDPPYNTGAKDWKYNNDYVDGNDAWRHSKWLSMMKKRLLIAKKLLKETGIFIVTIDDNELSHLDCILLEIFPEYDRFIVAIEHSKRGRRGKNMAKSNEFGLFLVRHGLDVICQEPTVGLGGETRNLRRTGSGSLRSQRHKKFYPIYIDTCKQSIIEVGDFLPLGEEPSTSVPEAIEKRFASNSIAVVWPIDEEGVQKNWHYAAPRTRSELELGKLSAREQSYGWQVYYKLRERDSKKYKTVWTGSHLDASTHGTELLTSIIGRGQTFDFPKSLYAVVQCLYAAVLDNPDALLVDFFAGSGTTLHAVNLLNAELGGNRRCILVTNNEVSEAETKELKAKGYQPGEQEWEKHGICESVTWPRTKYSIQGKRDDGTTLDGEYFTSLTQEKPLNRSFVQIGFTTFFQLDNAAKKKQLVALLGKDRLVQSLVQRDSRFIVSEDHPASILFDDTAVEEWLEALEDQDHIREFYIITENKRLFDGVKDKIQELLGDYVVQEPIKRPMSEGFKANVEYFMLGFLDKHSVALGKQFREIVPMLWLKSGAKGGRPEVEGHGIPHIFMPVGNNFAVLTNENYFDKFLPRLEKRPDIEHVFIVTNSETAFREMASTVNRTTVTQLYRDYLENFVINSKKV